MRKKLLLISALILSALSQAQVKPTAPTKEAPSRIKVYTPSGEVGTSRNKTNDNSYKWVVKTDLVGILTGEFPLIGEYRFAKKFSVEASAGVTYAYLPNDLLIANSIDNYNSDSGNTKAAMGTAFRGTIKFYPSSDYDAIEGWNFGIQLFSKTTNREYNYSGSDGALLNGLKDSKSKTGISLIIGKQIFEDSNITLESYFGVGIANNKREYSQVSSTDANGNYVADYVVTKTITETRPNLQVGFRIGFGN